MYSQINPGYGMPSNRAYNAMNSYAGSELENMVSQYAIEGHHANEEMPLYRGTEKNAYHGYNKIAEEQPVMFLNPQRPKTQFIGRVSELTEHIREAFFLTTGMELPQDIEITIDSRERLSQKNSAFLNASVAGLSINKSREIFVVSGKLDEVMLTVGHEIGHVIKPTARTAEEEEAKAFAFEAAWAQAIFENDTAGLRSSINSSTLKPAKNGLHDVAFNFVKKNSETSPLKLFEDLSSGNVTQQQIFGEERLPEKGIYGTYAPTTSVETLNQTLLRKDIEQMHKTMGREYGLHHAMKLPDGYAP